VTAVCIVPILRPARDATGEEAKERIVLVRQFRPPVGKVCLECPAGLIDKHETAHEAAHRELQEETGYRGKVVHTTPIVHCDPGFSNASMIFVYMDIDMNDPHNQHPQPTPDDGECIEIVKVPVCELSDYCKGR
jgi:ADP-ribose pyrophosphatase